MFRFCLVGFGRWGKVYFETIKRLNFCTLDCIVLKGFNPRHEQASDTPTFHRIEDVIGKRDVDGFIIATPPETHLHLAQICLSHKYPVLVEKPFTTNFGQASQLIEIAKESQTMCMVGYQHLFAKSYLHLKKLVNFSACDSEIYSESLSNGPFRSNVSVFRDWGSHEFSIAIDLFNEIPISYSVKKIVGSKDEDSRGVYLMVLYFSLGRKYTSIFGNISEVKRRNLMATFLGGWACLNGLDQGGCVVMKNGSLFKPESIVSTGTMPLDLMLNQFVVKSKVDAIDLKSLDVALEIVLLIDKIEVELKLENSNV
jgi:hypothetical protein